ncbi:hypothetical protein WICANDRAFT_62715 [Wickerhamomyces anomalus NRRL Y-366-8]|uniref:Sodium/calcium exchanger membrane region domain-containing protein n=1 Tax=Wickerhamomyces anomalus (strain ATCC 58044 / CBS 1984 / NCYC 433 / NRRL Y-366-8) TaxID=683960 RepID=A0A1E3P5G4_WICAA|nr:uncharacterized protein WICANDRAFT_62715 [Wickerhamomyces anomalus NRRL Y-366-8]ODQ60152.1 hypothetical protein WICANDRAFT_62715 [Wickerhamomyces anomalus NRRL Y-366-8]
MKSLRTISTLTILTLSLVVVAVTAKNVVNLDDTLSSTKQINANNITSLHSHNTSHECHEIHTIPKDQQCQFINTYCGDYKIGLINYVSLYYCHGAKILKLISFAFILIILFTTLGITASDFLCPNLETISKFFKMSESLAGVTLLALGNGSPDVFSTLEAMKINSANLAIGELCGAALFITGVVVGSMSIVRPFKVAKKPFIRDLLFLIFALIITTVFLSDEKITVWEALVMMLLYVVYVVFVVFWDWITTKNRRIQLMDQKIRNHYYNKSEGMTPYQVDTNQETNDDDILGNLATPDIEELGQELESETVNNFDDWNKQSQTMMRTSLLGAIEFNTKMQDFYEGREGAIKLSDDVEDHGNILLNTMGGNTSNITQPPRLRSEPLLRDENEVVSNGQIYTAPADYNFDSLYDNPSGLDLYNAEHLHADYGDVHDILKNKLKEVFEKTKLFNGESSFLFTLFPTLKNFKSKSFFDKFFSIICLPLVAILRLTVPVVDEDFTIKEKGFKLLVLQCIFAPFVTAFLNFSNDGFNIKLILFPSIISATFLCLSFVTKAAVEKGSELSSKVFKICCALLGFGISVSWISTIAAELISIIKFFALLLNLSDAILGITIFAIGNSLGDFISNFTIARMGFPMMALSACFGGPLLNILLGIGGSGLLIIPINGPIELKLSKTLIVSGIGLFINLLFLLIAVPLNRFEMNKVTGWFMVGLWCITTSICVIIEIFS